MINKPSNDMFYSKNYFMPILVFICFMKREHFEQIQKMIHFTILYRKTQISLRKRSSFLESLVRVYVPKQNVVVKEYLFL